MMTGPGNASLYTPGKAADKFGCTLTQLATNQNLSSPDMDIFCKATRSSQLDQVSTSGSDQGFLVGVSLRAGHQRRIFQEHHATSHDFFENTFYIRNLADDYKADLCTPFDFMLFQISPSSLAKIADDADVGGVNMLLPATAGKDIVLTNLARALMPALQRPEEANALFVDQMTTAIGTYLVQRYGLYRLLCERRCFHARKSNWQNPFCWNILKEMFRLLTWRRPATCRAAISSVLSAKLQA